MKHLSKLYIGIVCSITVLAVIGTLRGEQKSAFCRQVHNCVRPCSTLATGGSYEVVLGAIAHACWESTQWYDLGKYCWALDPGNPENWAPCGTRKFYTNPGCHEDDFDFSDQNYLLNPADPENSLPCGQPV